MKKTKIVKWKRRIAFALSLALMFTMLPDAWPGAAVMAATAQGEEEITLEGENVALKATAGADYSNTGTDPKNVNNGYLAAGANTTWNTWNGDNKVAYPAPIWLEWKVSQELDGMRVVWWADSPEISGADSVTFPKSCTVEYLNDAGEWVRITGMVNESGAAVDEVGVLFNSSDGNGVNGANKQWNTVKFSDKIRTKKLRLLVERSGTGKNGVGISEWEVYGNKAADAERVNIAGEATVEAEYSNNGSSTANVNDGKLAGNATSKSTWNTWREAGDLTYPYPIVMKWKRQRTLSGMKVMWWADDAKAGDSMDGVMFPKSCEAEYWDRETNAWVKITGMTDEAGNPTDNVGVKFGVSAVTPDEAGNAGSYLQEKNRYWNEVKFSADIQTDQVRLLIAKPDGASKHAGVGIGEWEVYGEYEDDIIVTGANIAPQAKASAEYSNTGTSPEKVNNMELGGNSSTSWNTWKKEGDLEYPQPITLTWEKPFDITSMRVMWWADDLQPGTSGGDGVVYPKNCEVWYFDYGTGDWKQITDMEDEGGNAVSSVGVNQNGAQGSNRAWNGVAFTEPVKTTKLQLRINRPDNTVTTGGIGIGEWEVFGKEITDEFIGAEITGKKQLLKSETSEYHAESIPGGVTGEFSYEWTVPAESQSLIQISGAANQKTVSVKALEKGAASIRLKMTSGDDVRQAEYEISIDEIAEIEDYVTTTTPGKAPILPDTVVAKGVVFDDPTPSLKSTTKDFDFGESFNSKLMAVEWKPVDKEKYAAEGNSFEVEGTVANTELKAVAKVTVKKEAQAAAENSTVTFENVELTDEFWLPKQKINALNSLNKAIYQIQQPSGGEPNFDNAIKKLNGEPYEAFSGLVFQDTDIYKTLEAISYTLSVIKDEKEDAEIIAQKAKLEKQLESWIQKIEKVQYADGYINTHFTLRSQIYEGGRAPGTHRWRNMSNHEMYVAGHFLESVVAYTRYREGIGDPDYRLYVAGRRFADHIEKLFGPNGTRHEVPGHEEIELALVKFAKLAEEYEGEGAGDKYVQTAKTLIDRRGEDYTLRESGYRGYQDGVRAYSQDAKPFTEETNAVGHAVRATYLYTGATDVARLLSDDDPDKQAYMNILDTIWDSVANRKTYITGGIGVASHGEDFGGDYELPNNDSYNEICASIALTNWNQRMNLVHEDSKYVDVMERALYNGILVGTNLEGNKFYYANKLEIPKKGGSTDGGMYGGVQRQDWFNCACCPPNLMRTIAKLSEYMYTIHGDNVYVNLFVGSDGNLNVDGTEVNLVQNTKYPWEGSVGITVTPKQTKEFTMNIRIPSWVKDQENKDVVIKVVDADTKEEESVDMDEKKGYVAITREWKQGDVIRIEMPMEIRKTETNPKIETNKDKIAIERGPIVYALEKAGNAQLNSGTIGESNFDPRNFVIPRDSELTADYKADLLKGVTEITGNVKYKNGDTVVDAKLQAVPFYASNNRGDTNEYKPNGKSTRMTVWTNASGTQPLKRTVTLDANGGTVSQTTITVRDGQTVGSLPKPERTYFKFLGWYTAKEGGEQVTKDTVVTADMTIYARWEKDATITIYTVTFDANGGKVATASIDKEKDQKIGTLPAPTKTGSTFLGWYTEKDGGEEITKDTVVDKDFTAYAHWNDPDVVFGASGSQENLGIPDVYLIAMSGDRSTEGNSSSAAYIQDVTATGGNKLGSTRIGCLAFKLQDAWRNLDLDKIKATVTINVADINHELGENKTKAGLFAVDADLADITLTDAASYSAKNEDYSQAATVFSKEWISASELGKKTFDVTEIVKEILKNEEAAYAIFRLQTVTSGFLVSNSGENAPSLTVTEDGETNKQQGSLTINCAGFVYDGTSKPAPEMVDTTNTGAEVTYHYYADAECSQEIDPPVNAGTYYVRGTAQETETYTQAVSEAVSFTIESKEMSGASVSGIEDKDYTGAAVTQPGLNVEGCREGNDYTVSYENNINVGKATVIITFRGNYTGTIRKDFQIKNTSGNQGGNNNNPGNQGGNNNNPGNQGGNNNPGNQGGNNNPGNQGRKPVPAKNKVFKSGKYQYKVTKSAAKNGTVELKAPANKKMTSVTVPSTVKINGYTFKVTSIAKNAFKNNKKLKKVTIGANVTKIGANAFSGCKALKKITVKSKNLKSVGKNALKNIHKKAVISVPKAKKKAYKKIFKGKGQKKTVQIK